MRRSKSRISAHAGPRTLTQGLQMCVASSSIQNILSRAVQLMEYVYLLSAIDTLLRSQMAHACPLQEGATLRRSAHRWAVSMYMTQEPLLLW